MNVVDTINRRDRIAESRQRLAAGRHKLQGGAHGAASSARSSMADAQGAARDAVREARTSLSSAGKAVKATRRGAQRAIRRAYVEARVGAARRRASRPRVDAKKSLGIAGLAGAAGAFFLDPDSGARRRSVVRDRTVANVRRIAERFNRWGGPGRDPVEGMPAARRASEGRPSPTPANNHDPAERVHS